MPNSDRKTCETLTEWGRCSQEVAGKLQCAYHHTAGQIDGFPHDSFYHRKVVLGLVSPSHDVLGNTEVDALFRGRARNDGRRTDLYTIL